MGGFKVFLLLFWTAAAWEGRLEINAHRQFRIVQFSDLHLGEDDDKDEETFLVMGRVLETNPCELAVITGDLLSDYAHIPEGNARAILTKLNGVFEKRAVPYFFVKGTNKWMQATTITISASGRASTSLLCNSSDCASLWKALLGVRLLWCQYIISPTLFIFCGQSTAVWEYAIVGGG